jgi:hypothetical protein
MSCETTNEVPQLVRHSVQAASPQLPSTTIAQCKHERPPTKSAIPGQMGYIYRQKTCAVVLNYSFVLRISFIAETL